MNPVPGRVYTLSDILLKLNLRDSPALIIHKGEEHGAIQDAHCTVEQMLSVPGLSSTEWRYIRTTHEWVPVFHNVGDKVLECVDIEPYAGGQPTDLWITPRGFPRNQDN